MKTATIPKTVQKWIDRNPAKVETVDVELDEFDPDNGDYSVWCYLKPGLQDYDSGVHFLHEASAKNFLAAAKDIQICGCPECIELLMKENPHD